MHVRNKKSWISSSYLLLCGFFFSCFSFPNLRQMKNREFLFHITCFFAASFFCFPFSFAMRPSFTVVIRQCSVNCMQLPSPQLHLTCVLLYHIHIGETIYTALYSETTTTMMEQQKSNRADGTWGRSTWKNEKYSNPRPFHMRFANWHIWLADTTKLCTDTARSRT